MKNTVIANHNELTERILFLRTAKDSEEGNLKAAVAKFLVSFNPTAIAKKSLLELVEDKNMQIGLAKIGLTMGANFIIDEIVGNTSIFRRVLSVALTNKLSGVSISNALSKTVGAITKMFKPKSAYKSSHY